MITALLVFTVGLFFFGWLWSDQPSGRAKREVKPNPGGNRVERAAPEVRSFLRGCSGWLLLF